jgi:hypothetical protein
MAKYDITYSCGCVGTVNLFGKTEERNEKIAWLKTQDCWQCKQKSDMEKVKIDETPVTISIKASMKSSATGGGIYFLAIATGGTFKEKETLKSLGFFWSKPQLDTGFFDLFMKKSEEKFWHKTFKMKPGDFESAESMAAACGIFDGKIGNYPAQFDLSYIDMELIGNKLKAQEAEAKEKAEKIGKSPIRAFSEEKGNFWNGKIYGNEKYGYRIYVDDSEYKIPSMIMEAQKEWYILRDSINAAEKEAVEKAAQEKAEKAEKEKAEKAAQEEAAREAEEKAKLEEKKEKKARDRARYRAKKAAQEAQEV